MSGIVSGICGTILERDNKNLVNRKLGKRKIELDKLPGNLKAHLTYINGLIKNN